MSDRDSLAGFSEAAAPDDSASDAGSFAAGPRSAADGPVARRTPASRAFRAHLREEAIASSEPLAAPLEFAIRPPPDVDAVPPPDAATPRPDSTDLKVESPPSSNTDAEINTALLRERIEARHQLGSLSPTSQSEESGISAAFAGLTRVIEQPSDSSVASGPSRAPRTRRYGLPAGDRAKRQRLTGLPENSDEDGQSAFSGIFGRDAPPRATAAPPAPPAALTEEDNRAFYDDDGLDNDNYGAPSEQEGYNEHEHRLPSAIRSDASGNDEYNGERGTSDDTTEAAAGQDDQQASLESAYVRPRPREPGEPEPPIVFEVPVNMIPEIDWLSVALDADGQVLEQRLEHSESESDSDASMGSLAEMINSDSSTEAESDSNGEWEPRTAAADDAALDDDSTESGSDSVGAATVSESEDSDFTPAVEVEVAEIGSRRDRPKRHRIPTVKWWLGERVQYEVSGPLNTLTAIDVRRVEPEKKVYRRRRPYRRRRGPLLPQNNDEADAEQQVVHAPVLDAEGGEFRERTVARSISGLEFEPMHYADGSIMPLVSRCSIFGGSSAAPIQLYVVRVQPGAIYTYEADANKVCTLVVWRGRCTAKMNRTDFDLQKGMACIVPPANDLYVDNGSDTATGTRGLGEDVFFFATEINARDSPELAAAMTRDAQSVVSGAATFSRLFQMGRNDDLGQGAESFVSGLHQFSRPEGEVEEGSAGDALLSDDEGRGGGSYDFGGEFDDHPGVLLEDKGELADDDTTSIAPSIFRDWQNDERERGDISQPASGRHRGGLHSFRIGRSEQHPLAAPSRRDRDDHDNTPLSFQLERGWKRPVDSAALAASDAHKGKPDFGTERQWLRSRGTTQLREAFDDEDELADFFAQVGNELDSSAERLSRTSSVGTQQPHQYMVARFLQTARRPNDTDTLSSGFSEHGNVE